MGGAIAGTKTNAPISHPLPYAFWSPVTTEFGQVLPCMSAILYGLPRFDPASMAGEPLLSQNCPPAAFASFGSEFNDFASWSVAVSQLAKS